MDDWGVFTPAAESCYRLCGTGVMVLVTIRKNAVRGKCLSLGL